MASRELHFVADDFGLRAPVNAAIIHGHRHGALTGASLMMGQEGTVEAVSLAREHPDLQVGWHLHLCDSSPLTVPGWPWGSSPAAAAMAWCSGPAARRLVLAEVAAQWEAFQSAGIACRFVNTHHHLHLHPWIPGLILKVVGNLPGVWFRGGAFRTFGSGEALMPRLTRWAGRLGLGRGPGSMASADSVWGVDRLWRMRAQEIRQVLPGLPDGRHEFLFQPRSLSGDADLEALVSLRRDPSRISLTTSTPDRTGRNGGSGFPGESRC